MEVEQYRQSWDSFLDAFHKSSKRQQAFEKLAADTIRELEKINAEAADKYKKKLERLRKEDG